MSAIDKLASSLGRRDEIPNQELAAQIVEKADTKAVQELVDNLSNKSRDIQNDCIKTLYEIGAHKPALISAHTPAFIRMLDSKNNRLQWGAMTALNNICPEQPEKIYAALPTLAAAAARGTVITRDQYVGILVKLLALKKYSDVAFHLLDEQLVSCPDNQFPMYAENALAAVPEQHKPAFIKTLTARLDNFEQGAKRKRLEKVLRKINSK